MADKRIDENRLKEINCAFVKLIESLDENQKKIYQQCPIDIVQFAKTFDFEVVEFEDDKMEGFILISDLDKQFIKMIAVNTKLSYEEKRFTVAHELSHYFLETNAISTGHVQIGARFAHIDNKFKNYNKSLKEQETDYFAACLLLPKETLLRDLNTFQVKKEGYEKFSRLFSNIYKVSYQCLYRRILEVTNNIQ